MTEEELEIIEDRLKDLRSRRKELTRNIDDLDTEIIGLKLKIERAFPGRDLSHKGRSR